MMSSIAWGTFFTPDDRRRSGAYEVQFGSSELVL